MVSAPHSPVCCPDVSGSDGVPGGVPVSLLQPALHRLSLQAHFRPGLGCPQVPMYPLCGDRAQTAHRDTAVSFQAQLRCRVRSRHKGDRGGITAQNPTQLIPLHRIKAGISHYQPGKPTSLGTSKDCRPASLQTRYGLPSSLQGGHEPRQLIQSLL